MAIAVDGDQLIETLLLQPAPPQIEGPPLSSFDDLVGRLEVYGRTSVYVADVGTGTCQPEFTHNDVVRPIGSAFKLYVLGALADPIARGDLAWDDLMMIQDDLKSLPSGTFQTRPEGSEATILEFAEAMIAVSDNTATDHLIDLVGRPQVEQMLAEYGNPDASLSIPFLTTREFFALKLGVPASVAEAYVAADEAGRRELLAGEIADTTVTVSDAITWDEPYLIDEIEWFATPTSLCRALVGLVEQANVPDLAEFRDILSLNPGVPFDPGTWSYVGYKGGSEPGVLALAWYLESVDGEAYVYVVNVTNPDAVLPEADIAVLAGSAFDLIAELTPDASGDQLPPRTRLCLPLPLAAILLEGRLVRIQERLPDVRASEPPIEEAEEAGCLHVGDGEPVVHPRLARRVLLGEVCCRHDLRLGIVLLVVFHRDAFACHRLGEVRAMHEPLVGLDRHGVRPLIHQFNDGHARHEADDTCVVRSEILEGRRYLVDGAIDANFALIPDCHDRSLSIARCRSDALATLAADRKRLAME